ncbi:unnamed protein product [Protopolystoma xenopodis]|uniref:Uncharacterized protein n=1 Tax=Protopolystoma xenopodis TaxID=117903 RepID=A0A3S5CMU0_9PLAT|nr:unnamed protein product [Protopolystoma xenopodis]
MMGQSADRNAIDCPSGHGCGDSGREQLSPDSAGCCRRGNRDPNKYLARHVLPPPGLSLSPFFPVRPCADQSVQVSRRGRCPVN